MLTRVSPSESGRAVDNVVLTSNRPDFCCFAMIASFTLSPHVNCRSRLLMKGVGMKRAILCAILLLTSGAVADVITLTSGNKIECTVIGEGERVTFRKGASTFTIPREQVQSIRRDAPPATRPAGVERLPSADEVITALGRQTWATNVEQIPATVIDKGVLRNVPYLSHRAGEYEVNVYGDPEAPAGVEIGVYHELLNDPAAKQRCVSFISALVGPERAAALAKLNRVKDTVTVGEWTIEVTPPTDEDAYGGWWVSVYGEKSLELSRASAEELKSITVARVEAYKSASGEKRQRDAALAMANRAAPAGDEPRDSDAWTASDMSRARRPSGYAGGGNGGGSVYVRGYTRRDGTYVRSHTRSAPHGGGRGGGRR